jgi:hypothetical protein
VCLSVLGMGDVLAFVIKGDARAFMMGEGMRDLPAFEIKRRRAPRNACLLSFHNRRRALVTRVSLLLEEQARLGY